MSSLSRRSFVQACAAGAVIPLTHPAVAAAKAAQMSLGFSLYGMQSLKTEDALRQLASIGYDSVELCLNDGFDASPQNLDGARRQSIKHTLDSEGLLLTALMENLPLAGRGNIDVSSHDDRLRRAAELGHALSPDRPPIIETVLGGGEWEDVKQRLVKGVTRWAKLADELDITIAVKPHRSGAMNRPEHGLWLLEQVDHPRITLAYDYSHYAHRDLPLAETIQKVVPHASFIHVKDTVIVDGRPRFQLPGESDEIDYVKLLKLVDAAGYRGDVCVEVSGMIWKQKGYDPVAAAKQSYQHLAAAFAKANIDRP